MTVELSSGSRWRSAVCETEVIVVRPPAEPIDLRCGGHPVIPAGDEPPAGAVLNDAFAAGTAIGKRFAHPDSGLELLCVAGGAGILSVGEVPLQIKGAKPLPSSD